MVKEILSGWFTAATTWIREQFIWAFNKLIELLAQLLEIVSGLLPDWDPITVSIGPDQYGILAALNWVFPVGFAINCVSAIVLSTTLYFTVGILTRWIKLTN